MAHWKLLIGIVVTIALALVWLARLTDAIAKLKGAVDWLRAALRKTTLPVRLGMSKEELYKKLGPPHRIGLIADVWFQHSLVICYDRHGRTNGIQATSLPGGTSFPGRVEGIRLGQSLDECVNKLGSPRHWGNPPHISISVWEREKDLLIVETWRQPPNDPHYSNARPNTVKAIWLAAKNSYGAFQAIVAVAIEFIRGGVRPPQIEQGAFVNVDLSAPFFRSEYEIFGVAPHLFGGASLGVKFTDVPALCFWVYPLHRPVSYEPVIRGIYPLRARAEHFQSPQEAPELL
jgi:hypothetical protein